MRSSRFLRSVTGAVERLEGRVLLSTYAVTSLNASGPGSLTQAILDTNTHIGPDTITFAPGLSGIIALTNGSTITDDLTITGPGASVLTVSGGFLGDVYSAPDYRAALNISGLTIKGGVSGGDFPGIPITLTDCALGGVDTPSYVVVRRCTVSGGGIMAGGFDVSDSTISNSAVGAGYGDAAAVYCPLASNGGYLTNCTITDNPGDGIRIDDGTVTLTHCTVSNNRGDGVFNGDNLGVIDSTISGNGRSGIAGVGFTGLYVSGSTVANNAGAGLTGGEGLSMFNSTVANNMAGGINHMGGIRSTITNSTIVGNVGATVGGIAIDAVNINNTIVAGNRNSQGDASELGAPGLFDITGSNNLIGTGGSGGLVNGQNGNIVGVADPKLAPLDDYGGPTPTMPPLAGSPAIDRGSNALAVRFLDGTPLAGDQRGYYRIVNGTADVGSVEINSTPLVLGDANGDRTVNFDDLLILAEHYGTRDGVTWSDGDFNDDGKVDFADLLVLAQNYKKPAPAAAVSFATVSRPIDSGALKLRETRRML